jgi:Transposase and inactivated derivatives
LNDEFENTYFVAHQLTNALRQRKYDEFCAALTQSKAISPQLMSTIKTFKKYQKLIENMMNCPKLSNGPLEGINRKIKQIKRTAYGYRNWSRFNLRIRIELKIKVNKKKIIRK